MSRLESLAKFNYLIWHKNSEAKQVVSVLRNLCIVVLPVEVKDFRISYASTERTQLYGIIIAYFPTSALRTNINKLS